MSFLAILKIIGDIYPLKISSSLFYVNVPKLDPWEQTIFFYLGFLSRTFTIHGTAGEGEGYLFNSSLPLPPASQILRH